MDENKTTTEATEQTSDAFLDGWEDDAAPLADQPKDDEIEDAAEQQEAPAEETEAPHNSTGEEPPAQQQTESSKVQGAPEKEAPPKTWDLRHLDEVKTVDEAGMITLAQKGLDYDRVREKYDEAKPVMELFGQFAKQAGMSVSDYVAYIRTQAKRADGMSEEEAKRTVQLEDREAVVAAKEAQQAQKAQGEDAARKAEQDAQARRKADIEEFQKTFPDIAKDPAKIPEEVWAQVRDGISLTAAYAKYAVKQARADAENANKRAGAAEQNSRNAARAVGSMRTDGNEHRSRDPFLEGWDS